MARRRQLRFYYLPILFMALYVGVGHVVLPWFGQNNFWFMSRWELFNDVQPKTDWFDLTAEIDGKRVSLARDLAQSLAQQGANTTGVWANLNEVYSAQLMQGKIPESLRALLLKEFQPHCGCRDTRVIHVHGALRDYVLFRKNVDQSLVGALE